LKGVRKGNGLARNLILTIPFFILLGLCCIAGIGMAANVFTATKPTVSIEPALTPGLRPGDVFSVNVTVDPAGKGVSGAKVKIAFNASVVECEDVSPGNLLGDSPLEGKKVIDNENGMVRYALYRCRKVIDNENGMVQYALARIGDTPVPTEEGTLAVLSFKVKGDAPEGTYYLRITSAELTDENFNYISPIEIKNGTFTIGVPAPANITFSDLRVEPTEGEVPLEISVSASVENNGGSAGEYNATLKIDGEVVDYKTGTLSAGESKRVCFNYTLTEVGTYNVTIDGLPPVEVNVREKVVPTVSIELASTTLCPGDVFSVNVTVDPAGKGISGAEVKIAFNASVVECEDVSPGNLLGERPLELKKEIDNINGMIWYVVSRNGSTPVPTEEGTFAVLSFKVKGDAPNGTYYLRITSAELTDENFAYISPIEIKNGTFTIVPPPTNITFSDLRVEPTEGEVPLEIGVCALVENIGGSAGEYNATLKIDGEVVDYKTGTLNAGESKRVCFNYTFTETGTYNVTIDELPAITVVVKEIHDVYIDTKYTGTYGTGIRIDNATVEKIPLDWNLTVGETYYIKFKVVNNATVKPERVNITVEISNGTWREVLDKYEKDIDNHHWGNVTWDTSGLAPGAYTITVNASIPEDAHPEDNERTREVVLERPKPPPTIKLSLLEGWNFISVPLNVSDWSVPAVLSSIEGKYTMIWTYNASTKSSQIYMPGYEEFKELEPGRAYLIQMSEDATLEIEGTLLKRNISLLKGWNTFGVPYGLENYSLPDILDEHGLKNKYTMIWTYNASTKSSQIYMPGYEEFKELTPGRGYLIEMTESVWWEW